MDEPKPETMEVAVREPSVGVSETSAQISQVPKMQASLADWCRIKLEQVKSETAELYTAYTEAVKRKWKHSTLKTHYNRGLKRITYYEKVLSALESGYCLFPSVDCEIFAIRTTRETPSFQREWVRLDGSEPGFQEKAERNVDAGEGEYVAPQVTARWLGDEKRQNTTTGQTIEGIRYGQGDFQPVDFPLIMAKPHIMQGVGEAMALKIFDEIGIIKDYRRFSERTRGGYVTKGDPIIVGRIYKPSATTYKEQVRTFLIAWHVDVHEEL